MAQDVISVGNGLGHGKGVGVVVLNHVVTGPGTWGVASIDETLCVDLEELQTGLVDLGAVAVAGGQVVEDGAVVALWPFRPLHLDLGTGLHGSSQSTGLCVFVADDIGALVVFGTDESKVCSLSRPTDGVGGIVRVGILVDEITAVAMKSVRSVVPVQTIFFGTTYYLPLATTPET